MSRLMVLTAVALLAFTGQFASAAQKKSRFEKLELFNKVLYLIESQYYRDVDTEKLIAGAIKGMMNTLDPHSTFLDDQVFEKMKEDTQGEFGGLGIEVTQKDGVIVVITPIDDTPAFKAGIKAGDRIVEINNESTMGITLEEAVDKMRGKAGSKVNVGVIREGHDGVKYFEVTRKIIQVKPVKSELLDESISYIRLTQFQKRSAENIISTLKEHAEKAKGKKLQGIVLDLRSNPGGLLDEAVDVSSIFLNDGVVVSTEGRDPKNKEIKYVKKKGFKDLETPVVVLLNGASASASEIVAGALQDHNRAIIMGTQSFGKGSVQTVAKIDDVQGVKLTIAQYMTPDGRKIQAKGIEPDVIVEEYDYSELEKIKIDSSFVREKDLKNHLTATIETEDEKKERIKKEKEERKERIKRIRERKRALKLKDKEDDDEELYKKYDPNKDFQVQQAVTYLQAIKTFKRITN